MRLLFLTDNFPPEFNAPSIRTHAHVVEWIKDGLDVTVITCFPNFPNGKVFDGYKNKLYKVEFIDGIKVVRVWSYISSNSGFVKRILDYISFGITSFIAGLFIKTDIIIGTSPQFFTAISAMFLSIFKRKPWVMEVRDLWPDSIVAVGYLSKDSIIFRFLKKIETTLYRNANKIVVVSKSFKKYLIKNNFDKNKISIIYNGFQIEKKSKKTNIDLRKKLNLKNKYVISYIGTIGMAHALDFIIESINDINKNFHFVFIGDGAMKKKLIIESSKKKLNNVTFVDSVPRNEIFDYIDISDASLVNLKKSDDFKKVIPSKIFENVFLKKPILLGVEGESKYLIEKYSLGIAFLPENKDSFLSALDKIIHFKIDSKYERNRSNFLDSFDRKKLAKKMLYEVIFDLK